MTTKKVERELLRKHSGLTLDLPSPTIDAHPPSRPYSPPPIPKIFKNCHGPSSGWLLRWRVEGIDTDVPEEDGGPVSLLATVDFDRIMTSFKGGGADCISFALKPSNADEADYTKLVSPAIMENNNQYLLEKRREAIKKILEQTYRGHLVTVEVEHIDWDTDFEFHSSFHIGEGAYDVNYRGVWRIHLFAQ